MPAEASQQGQRVDRHEPLDPIGMPLGEHQPGYRTPVMDHELHAIHSELAEQTLKEISLALDRVVQMTALR